MQAEAGRQAKEGRKELRKEGLQKEATKIELKIYIYIEQALPRLVCLLFSSNSIAKPERERERARDGGEGYDGDKTKPSEAMAIAKRKKKVKWKAELV